MPEDTIRFITMLEVLELVSAFCRELAPTGIVPQNILDVAVEVDELLMKKNLTQVETLVVIGGLFCGNVTDIFDAMDEEE